MVGTRKACSHRSRPASATNSAASNFAITSERTPRTAQSLSDDLQVPLASLTGPLNSLCERHIAQRDAAGNLQLTPGGNLMRDRMLLARRKGVEELIARWEPDIALL